MAGLGLTNPAAYIYVTIKNKIKVMKLKKELPKHEIVFTNTSPFKVNLLLDILGRLGVAIDSNTIAYDPDYPYLVWGSSNCITQSKTTIDKREVNTIEDFLEYFVEDDTRTIYLTDDYQAIVKSDKIIVGCQTISYEKLKEVWDTINALRTM